MIDGIIHLKFLLVCVFNNIYILKEINPDISLEEMMLKVQYFGYLM